MAMSAFVRMSHGGVLWGSEWDAPVSSVAAWLLPCGLHLPPTTRVCLPDLVTCHGRCSFEGQTFTRASHSVGVRMLAGLVVSQLTHRVTDRRQWPGRMHRGPAAAGRWEDCTDHRPRPPASSPFGEITAPTRRAAVGSTEHPGKAPGTACTVGQRAPKQPSSSPHFLWGPGSGARWEPPHRP